MKTISIYQVEDIPLGSGGMGRVLRGSDQQGHPVAVKEILEEHASDFEIRTRTEREVEILQILNNTDNIVKVYDRFPLGNNFYIVMELVDGLNIEQYIQKYGAMTYQRAIFFMIKILETMQSVHEKNIVHRDMKPSNIMIRNDERICILDFGIAKDMGNQNSGTICGTAIGSDGYMSPEQANGLSIDRRADIYALGCVFYFMLTGHHAYNTLASDFETRDCIVKKPFPRLSEHSKAAFPSRLQEILDRATDKNMMCRYQSCREFRKDLETLITGQSTHISSKNKSEDILVTVGREDCDIIIGNDEQMRVSRHHLDIVYKEFTGGRYYVITDHSSNGTFVNGRDLHRNESESIPADGSSPTIYLACDKNYALNWSEVQMLISKKIKEQSDQTYDPDPTGNTQFDDKITNFVDNTPSDVSFVDAVKLFFTKAFDFSGRSRRKEYWYVMLAFLILEIPLLISMAIESWNIERVKPEIIGIYGLFSFLCIIPSISLTVRRLHDIGKSWTALLMWFGGTVGAMFITMLLGVMLTIATKAPIIAGVLAFVVYIAAVAFWIKWMATDSEPETNQWGPCPKD